MRVFAASDTWVLWGVWVLLPISPSIIEDLFSKPPLHELLLIYLLVAANEFLEQKKKPWSLVFK